jgi:AcrR family transcriptional regulator
LTVSELADRRARKKAQTHAGIRRSARQLFDERGFEAVTIADIADAADVAVQTVFNHFPTKEELFFDGYTPWVDGGADAIRNRPAGVRPLVALRAFSEDLLRDITERSGTRERRRYVTVLNESPSLLAYELRLLERAELRLCAALTEAWTADPDAALGPAEIRVSAALTAALWISAVRSLVRELRDAHLEGGDAAGVTEVVHVLAERVFDALEAQTGAVPAQRALRLGGPLRRAAEPQTLAFSAAGATTGSSTSSITC